MSYNLSPTLRQRFLDSNGDPLAGGLLYSYQSGTTTPQATYVSSSGAANANPVVLDANGEADVWLDPALSYKFVLKNSSGVTQWTVDSVIGTLAADAVSTSALQNLSVTTAKIAAGAVTLVKMDDNTFGPGGIRNLSITATVAASALTITLKDAAGSTPSATSPAKVVFRSSTATAGTPTVRSATAATSLVISNGSTLGHANAVARYIYIYAIDNAGTIELAASSALFDEGTLQSTTAEGSGGGADSGVILYSTTLRTSVPIRLIGRLLSTQATAGAWVTAISEIALTPFTGINRSEIRIITPTGFGSTNTEVIKWTSAITTGSAFTFTQSATLGDSVTINEDGVYSGIVQSRGTAGWGLGILKGSTTFVTISDTTTLCYVLLPILNYWTESAFPPTFLPTGTILRAVTTASSSLSVGFWQLTKVGN